VLRDRKMVCQLVEEDISEERVMAAIAGESN
jgi:hypothetical protein